MSNIPALIAYAQTIPDSTWDAETQMWTSPSGAVSNLADPSMRDICIVHDAAMARGDILDVEFTEQTQVTIDGNTATLEAEGSLFEAWAAAIVATV